MQTFIPDDSYTLSALVLDHKRLGNQYYNEGIVLVKGKWKNHPASKMWRGYTYQLCEYLKACDAELLRRGRDYPKWRAVVAKIQADQDHDRMPSWWGDDAIHSSHRAALLYKNYDWYKHFGWREEPKLAYVWPV